MTCCYCEVEIHLDERRVTMGELIAHQSQSICADLMRKRLAQAVAAERARCAKVARALKDDMTFKMSEKDAVVTSARNRACEEIAAAIERGEG